MDCSTIRQGRVHTVRMEDVSQELHLGWTERVVLGEVEYSWEYPAFERCLHRSGDKSLPDEWVGLVDGISEYTLRWSGVEETVLMPEAFAGYV